MTFLPVSRFRGCLAGLLMVLGLAACQPASAATRVAFTPIVTNGAQTAAPAPDATPAAAPTATVLPPHSLWIDDSAPQRLRESVVLTEGWEMAENAEEAGVRLDVLTAPAEDGENIPWVYALAAPFPTVTDEITLAEVQNAWKGTSTRDLPFTSLLVEPDTTRVFNVWWGPASAMVKTLPAGQMLDAAWEQKTAWAILPFEQLEPRWKVIAVDGQSPVRKDFDPSRYGLAVNFALQGDPAALEQFLADTPVLDSNRLAERLTTVMVTGVTALVRGTASYMETRGITYPAQDIGGWLREADILHISNEVAFWKTCPLPHDWKGLAFCSRPKYIELLEDVGADVIELTGDHLNDWGPEAIRYTLELYQKEGWKTYGGGANIEEARQPALFEHNGNKIAFIGCNAKPKGYSSASETEPGAVHCDMEQLAGEVRKLRADGYQPIVTFQHLEYYSYTAHPLLQADFRQMAEAGAVIVSGSQAHQPHPLEFKDGALLHYGLGNLFFDQTNQGDAPMDAFIDRHVFYDNRLISTELLTIHLVDLARSRPMTPEERQALLATIFEASGW